MTSEQFCYWLQGYFELKKTIDHRDGATPETMKMIEEHLQTVFSKVTPTHQPPTLGVSGQFDVRTLELRPEDRLRQYMGDHKKLWPNGDAPVITC